MNLLLGVDIGTTKLCVIALDGKTGKIHTVRSAPNRGADDGCMDDFEQSPSSIMESVFSLIGEVASSLPDGAKVDAIGVTGQMHGVLLASKEGKPQGPLVTWRDPVGNRFYGDSGHTIVEEVRLRLGEEQTQRTGTTMASGFGAATLFRLKDRIRPNSMALTIHDFLVFRLTGKALTDPSDAASWGIYDAEHQSGWLDGVEKTLELPEGVLPMIQPTGSIAGALQPPIASQLGLSAGIPVAVALGDNQASFIGSVPSLNDSVLFNIGTGGQTSVAIDCFNHKKGLDTRPLVAGKWLRVGASLCGGSALKILASFFSDVGAELFDTRVPVEQLYDRMVALAASADDKQPRFEPLFQGTRSDPERSASITGLRIDNFDVAHLTRALLRGMMEELVGFCDANVPKHVVGSGNGFRLNPVLRNEFASRLNVEVLLPPNQEEAAVGAAISAGIAVGLYSTWDEAGHILYTSSA
jgi:sedoheptulokinase